jgi:hypothetical protein
MLTVSYTEYELQETDGVKRKYSFSTIPQGETLIVTVGFTGSGTATYSLSRAKPLQTIESNHANVHIEGNLTLSWDDKCSAIFFTGTLVCSNPLSLVNAVIAVF